MKILFSFVSHDSYSDLLELVRSFDIAFKQTDLSFCTIELLFLENSSRRYTNHELIAIKSTFVKTSIEYIENNGYNNALNYALSTAKRCNFNFLIAGNPDISFRADYLSDLIRYFSSIDFDVAVPNVLNQPYFTPQNPRIINFDQALWRRKMSLYFSSPLFFYIAKLVSLCRSYVYLLFSFMRLYVPALAPEHLLAKPSYPIDIPCGVQFIFNISNLPPSFTLDDHVFLWGEEILLHLKLKEFNLTCSFFTQPTIYHKPSSSVSSLSLRYFFIQRRSFNYILSYLAQSSPFS